MVRRHAFSPPADGLRPLAVAAALVLAAACGDDGEGPNDDIVPPDDTENPATMQAFVTDDVASGDGRATYHGTTRGRADVEVSADQTTWWSLGAPRDFQVELRNGEERIEISGSAEVPATTYRWVRINFSDVEAVLSPGSTVEGETLQSEVHLRLGDTGRAVTSGGVDAFELDEGASAHVVLDLSSDAWITVENLSRRQIPKEEFEDGADLFVEAAE